MLTELRTSLDGVVNEGLNEKVPWKRNQVPCLLGVEYPRQRDLTLGLPGVPFEALQGSQGGWRAKVGTKVNKIQVGAFINGTR